MRIYTVKVYLEEGREYISSYHVTESGAEKEIEKIKKKAIEEGTIDYIVGLCIQKEELQD